MKILLDFLNAERSLEGMKDFLVKVAAFNEGLPPKERFWIRKRVFKVRDSGGPDFWMMSRQEAMELGKYDQHAWQDRLFVYQDDPDLQELLELDIEPVHSWFCQFVESCKAGTPDIGFLNRLYVLALFQTMEFVSGGDPFQPSVRIFRAAPESVHGYVAMDILSDFLGGRGYKYQKITKCTHCGQFTAGSLRREYCSTQCRNAHLYQRRKTNAAIKSQSAIPTTTPNQQFPEP